MKEGSLEAPVRHTIDWQDESYYDASAIEEEMRRVFDICHGCRRCFNLCESFPRLFDMIDEAPTGELDSVRSSDFASVADACTLCDMCFMTKCPYVPPHDFDLDFPHLILRYRAAERRAGGGKFVPDQLGRMDRNAALIRPIAPLANWATRRSNTVVRWFLEKVTGIDARVILPKFFRKSFVAEAAANPLVPNAQAPAFGRKVALYATCYVNNNAPRAGLAARKLLAHNGVETRAVYPACCGMPYLEQGDVAKVAEQAVKVAGQLRPLVDQGLPIIPLTASCSLMFKFEWPLILPENEDVAALSAATMDITEYLVDIAKNEGLIGGMKPLIGGITVHSACHARAQNMGAKALQLMKYIPDTQVDHVERCSGHGGTFGVMAETHDAAMAVGKTAMRTVVRKGNKYVTSECPLAAKHLMQGVEVMDEAAGGEPQAAPEGPFHPAELMAKAYGLIE
jgi:glycerol-3-phosphate dehydrogenase subunit C